MRKIMTRIRWWFGKDRPLAERMPYDNATVNPWERLDDDA